MGHLLFFLVMVYCHIIQVAGVLEWTVIRKATDYGQNVTLFCNVSNCCPQYSGWDRWTPEQNTLFIDIKTGRPNRKYDGMVVSGGYTLIIQNLTKQDLNISYSCVYGGTIGERKLLLEQDVFTFSDVLEWTVIRKATYYGQNVTLFCNISNCCPQYSGWDRWTPEQNTLFIDVKTGRHNTKYDGMVVSDGYTLIIQNLTKQDLNISYSCVYGGTLGEKKILLEQDVFTYISTTQPNASNDDGRFSGGEITGIIVGVTALFAVVFSVVLFWRQRKKRKSCIQIPVPIEEVPLLSGVYFLKDPSDIECKEGEEAIFTFQIRSDSPSVILLKDGKDITGNDNYKMSSEGTHHEMKLKNIKYTDAGEYSVQVGQSYRKVLLSIKELPTIEEKNTYLNVLQSGEEERRYVRIQVIGKEKVGKTSLVRRLLGQDINDVESTDGIDINKTCQIRTSDGEWIIGEVEEERVQIEKRIQQAVNKRQEIKELVSNQVHPFKDHLDTKEKPNMINQSEDPLVLADKDKNRILLADENNDNEPATKFTNKHIIDTSIEILYLRQTQISSTKDSLVTLESKQQHTSNSSNNTANVTDSVNLSAVEPSFGNLEERDMKKVEQMPDTFEKQNSENSNKSDQITAAISEHMDDILYYVKNKKHKMTSEGLVECGIWDFAGQKDYYATHQTFFTPDAIYLLVVDITDDIEAVQHSKQFNIDSSGEYIDFWLDSIHCFRTDRVDHADVQDITAHLRPPVIIVCTGIDKVTDIKAKKKEYESKFLETFGNQKKSSHKRGIIHFISNKEFHKEDFENLKKDISETAKEMRYSAKKLPTKWILLENSIAVLRDVKRHNKMGYCEKLENIVKLAQTISITKDELICFLNFQHKIGNIIFFEDKPGYIILQPQWLVDCFRCIMCDDNKKQCIQEDLYELKYRGILSVHLINQLFSKVPDLRFGDYEHHILDVMEKFDIIVRREVTKSYYLPCMIDSSTTVEDIMKEFHVKNVHCSPWLVFEFTFLPIAYYNHILFSYIRKYSVCEVNGHPALYTGKAVVFLDETKFARLIICFSRNTLSLQIWETKPVGDDIYQNIIEELCDKIDELKGELHKLDYKIKAKCSNGDPSIRGGRISYEDLCYICKDGEYFCEEHDNSHSKDEIENTWLKHNPTTSHSTLQTEHTEEIEHLRKLQDSHSILKTEHIEVTGNLRKLQDSYSNLQAEHSKVTELLKDPIPWNIREQIDEELETWSEDDKMFIQTTGAKRVLNSIKENGCVVVTGSLGSGKSSAIRHVALEMQSEGYDILPVSNPEEIIKWYNPSKKILFVVEDFCGTYSINQMKFERWKNLTEKIKTLIEKKSVKLIMSCRLQVYRDKSMKFLSFYRYECNLLSENMCLSKKEKQSIAELYLKKNASKISELYDMFDCFPLLCQLCSKNTQLSIVDFFKNPFIIYKEEIDKLQTEGAQIKYCALALCVVFNNCVKEEWLLEEVDKDIKTIIENTYEVCRVVNGTSRLVLRDELDSLTHTFIQKDGGVYRAIHEKVFDFLVFYFGTVMIYFLVNNAPSQFIRKRFVCEGSIKRDKFLIVVSERYQLIYLKRMVDDWLKGNVEDVYCNINMDDQIFRRRFLVYVKGLEIFEQKQLASSNDRYNNSTPLIQCCYIGDIDLITWCLYHCISNINHSRIGGETPLFIACQNGHTEIVQMLINNKADINRSRDNGESPLFIACQNGHTEIVQILMNNKVDINKCRVTGESPLDIALQNGHHAIIHILRKHDFDTV